MTQLIRRSQRAADIEAGRFVWVQAHPFAAPDRMWMAKGLTLGEMAAESFPQDAMAPHIAVRVDGRPIPVEEWDDIPAAAAIVEIYIKASKGVLRSLIRAIVVFAVVVVGTYLFGPTVGSFLGKTVGNFLGNLAANALIPPANPYDNRLDAPTIYTIEGARNSARIGQPVPLVLGTRRVFGDLIVPFYQEVVGEDIYIRGAVCWGYGDYSLAALKNGDTLLSSFDGIQVQHSLTAAAPMPTLIPGIPTALAVGADLNDNNWATRTTAADAEEVEILLYFPQGLGELTDKGKKKSHTLTLQVRYKEVDGGGEFPAYRDTSAPTIAEADLIAEGLGYATRRDIWAGLGDGYSDAYHTALAGGGSVNLTRTFTKSAPGEPFFDSFKFALPPGKQFDIEVRRSSAVSGSDEYFEDVTWTGMNSWKAGNPFPNPLAAVTAVRVKASEELSGALDTINAVISNLVRTFDSETADAGEETAASFAGSSVSSNGADQLLHIALGPHQLRPTPEAEINWPAFARFWELCDLNGFTFDFVEMSGRRKGELQQLVGSACRARVLRIDGLLTPVLDAPQPAGPRTILTPENASQFIFQKLFPADVHALRIEFENKDNGFKNDERIVYMDGYDAETAVNFDKFSLPGVVDADLIFRHAKYFEKTEKLQTLTGSCVQDIEGGLLLRYGDRIGVRHSTLKLTSESGWIEELYKNEGGDITGFRLSEAAAVNTSESFVVRWRKMSEDVLGRAALSAAQIEALSIDADEETSRFTFATPISAATGFAVGTLAVVGLLDQDIIDALVRGVEPLDDEGRTFKISWTLYAALRFADLEVPAHTPLVRPDLIVRPAAPVLIGSAASDDGIYISFEQEAVFGVDVTGFEVWSRETPAIGADTPWQPLSNLPAAARLVTLPAARPGQSFDIRLVAIGSAGLRSDPVIGTDYSAAANVPAPVNAFAAATLRAVSGGAQVPVILAGADEVDDPALFETLVIEMKRSADSLWRIATTAPADNPIKDITAVTAGETYDVRLAWRNIRGAITAEELRPVFEDILIGEMIGSDTRNVGGTPAPDVNGRIQYLATSGTITDRRLLGAAGIFGTAASKISGTVTPGITDITLSVQVIQTAYGQITYNAGSVSGLTADTTYYLWASDPSLSGGSVTYMATTSLTDITAYPDRILFGTVTTQDAGGAGGGFNGNIAEEIY